MQGLKRGTVQLHRHDPAWIREGARIVKSLSRLFGRDCVGCAHVGSTAVPYLMAKPIIDIVLAVPSLEIARARIPEMRRLGYTFVPEGETEAQLLFSRRVGDGSIVTQHIHVVVGGSREWSDYIAFRDYLKGRPDIAREYEAKKRELLAAFPDDREAYTAGKAEFISGAVRRARLWNRLAKTVTVTIDRPLGSLCEDASEPYPVNVGYLPGVTDGEGKPQEVYLLGVERPVERYTGRVIAVLYRKNDSRDLLVVAPVGRFIHQATIMEKIWFRESRYETELEHLYHHSCGMVVYRRRAGRLEYLLLQEKRSTVWSIPKGHVERGETEEEAAIRELREEAGLSAVPIPGFRFSLSYPIPPIYSKTLTVFLAECDGEVSIREDEIRRYVWVDFRGAQNHFGGRRMMDAIRAANRHLRAEQDSALGADKNE